MSFSVTRYPTKLLLLPGFTVYAPSSEAVVVLDEPLGPLGARVETIGVFSMVARGAGSLLRKKYQPATAMPMTTTTASASHFRIRIELPFWTNRLDESAERIEFEVWPGYGGTTAGIGPRHRRFSGSRHPIPPPGTRDSDCSAGAGGGRMVGHGPPDRSTRRRPHLLRHSVANAVSAFALDRPPWWAVFHCHQPRGPTGEPEEQQDEHDIPNRHHRR